MIKKMKLIGLSLCVLTGCENPRVKAQERLSEHVQKCEDAGGVLVADRSKGLTYYNCFSRDSVIRLDGYSTGFRLLDHK